MRRALPPPACISMRARLSLLVAALAFVSMTVFAQGQQIQAGREYTRLNPPRPVTTGSSIEIIEFFYYGCPICYEVQPHLSRWLFQAPDNIVLRRVPALSSENWEPFAKLFYTLELIGELNRLHWPVYDNFHFDGVKLNDEKVMLDWVVRNGLDRQKFVAAYNSDEIKNRMTQSRELMKTYDVRGVPSVVVDGKYLTSARLAGGTRQLVQVLDQLVKLARKERPN